ncbi:MAG TPA: hypothetical protein VHH36_08940 [Candidatus Thermoplasmatota archaeon]|nr:hypothetical protein [Candidatus Thermoplasmatota archaeon]
MKTFVMTALAGLVLAATLAPAASASSVTVDALGRSIECHAAPLAWVDGQVNRLFGNVYVDTDDCSPHVRYDQRAVEANCDAPVLQDVLRGFYNVRVGPGCDVHVILA